MKDTFYRTETYDTAHSTYGGRIYASDFNTQHRGSANTNGSAIASRIIGDWKFDNSCKKNTGIGEKIR